MFIAQNETGEWVLAEDGIADAAYHCPKCNERLSLVKGSVHFIDHFRHRRDSSCSIGAEETSAHYIKKLDIALELEADLGKSVQGKRDMRRREVVQAVGADVECNRVPIATDAAEAAFLARYQKWGSDESTQPPLVSPTRRNEFQDLLQEFWSKHDGFSFHARMAMMGYK